MHEELNTVEGVIARLSEWGNAPGTAQFPTDLRAQFRQMAATLEAAREPKPLIIPSFNTLNSPEAEALKAKFIANTGKQPIIVSGDWDEMTSTPIDRNIKVLLDCDPMPTLKHLPKGLVNMAQDGLKHAVDNMDPAVKERLKNGDWEAVYRTTVKDRALEALACFTPDEQEAIRKGLPLLFKMAAERMSEVLAPILELQSEWPPEPTEFERDDDDSRTLDDAAMRDIEQWDERHRI